MFAFASVKEMKGKTKLNKKKSNLQGRERTRIQADFL